MTDILKMPDFHSHDISYCDHRPGVTADTWPRTSLIQTAGLVFEVADKYG